MISKRSACSLLGTPLKQRRFSPTGRSAPRTASSNYPRLGRVVPELGIENIREIILGGYRLIYRIQQDELQVVTVHHGARLLDTRRIERGA